ncbi:AMP-binding protein [Chromobacterium paludis]|uniref:Fatty acyl-AMP ligase n=1 Tax=Chromobacterium paludis TaxID=2605945 RepID=A0A5C1DMM0_9NEIS|nr:AMP-binding protein [Chromobacterium paludis]QEL57793.1 fatty acyl-AMP ligase [Chromobacterium paludis]
MTDAILSALKHAGPDSGQGIAVVEESGEEKRISHAELAQQALALASGLRELGAARGDLVILALPASIDHLLLQTACVLLGALPCTAPLPGRSPADSSRGQIPLACRLFSPRLVIAKSAQAEALRALLADQAVRVVSTEVVEQAAAAANALSPLRVSPDDAHHVQLTSGSTGCPKAVVLSHRNVIDNVRGIGGAVGYDPARGDASASWLPLYHDMGLITLLSNLYYQAPLLLMQPPGFIRNPLGWLKRIAAFGATTTATPTFGLQYCVRRYRAASMQGVDLSRLRNIFIGAERVDLACLQEFSRVFEPHGLSRSALQPCYGMAESTLAATMHDATIGYDRDAFSYLIADRIDSDALTNFSIARPADEHARAAETVLAMGKPIPGMAVRVASAEGMELKARQVGEIQLRGSSLMSGYLPADGQHEAYHPGEWFATGDLGYQADGQLFVLGRQKEIIIIRGSNYFPHEVEDALAAHPLLAGGSAIAATGIYDETQGTENLIVMIEFEREEEQANLRAELQALLRERFGFGAHAIAFVANGSLPRTTSGKLQRLKCRGLYIEQALRNVDAEAATA